MIAGELKFLLVHSSIYGVGTMVSQLVPFLLLPLYTRYLAPADYGVLQTVEVSSGLIGIVVTMGIARALSRFYYESEIQAERDRVVTTTYATYAVMAGLCALPLYLASGPLGRLLLDSQDYGSYFQVSFVTLLLGGSIDIGMMYLRLIKKPVIFVSVTTARLLLLIALNIFFVVEAKLAVLGILYSSLIVTSLFAVGLTIMILVRTGLGFSKRAAVAILKYGLPMIPSGMAAATVKQSDKYFVLGLLSVADMGIYALALKIGNALHNLLTVPFNTVYIPRRFELMKREEAGAIYSKIFTYYVFSAGFLGLALSVLIPEILHVMVTPAFFQAKDLVPLVVLSMLILGCQYHFDFGILYAKKTKYLAYINLVSAAIQVGFNYVLIRRYGMVGGVYSAIVALGIQALLLFLVSRRSFRIDYELGRVGRYVALAVAFYLASTQIQMGLPWADALLKLALLLAFPVTVIALGIATRAETAALAKVYASRIKPLVSRNCVAKAI